jgi:hypothetical protein
MDFADLKADVFSGGFSHLEDGSTDEARVERWVNTAYKRDVVMHAYWPFRQATATGAAPLSTITDLGPIMSVTDTATRAKLHPADRRTLVDRYTTLTTAGSPSYYYVENGVVKTFPVGGTLSVTYLKVPADLVLDADVPIVPADYQELIVFGALRRAHMDAQNADMVAIFKQELAEGLQAMVEDLLDTQADEPELVLSGMWEDG